MAAGFVPFRFNDVREFTLAESAGLCSPYFQSLEKGELTATTFGEASAPVLPFDLGQPLEAKRQWTPVAPRGVVEAFIREPGAGTVHAFALVRLENGVLFPCRITGVDPDESATGLAVTLGIDPGRAGGLPQLTASPAQE